MNLLGSIAVVFLFIVLIYVLRVVSTAREAITLASDAVRIMRDPSIDDEIKENQLQRRSLRLFAQLALLIAGFSAALALPLAMIWLLERAAVVSLEAVTTILLRWDFIALSSVTCVGIYLLAQKRAR